MDNPKQSRVHSLIDPVDPEEFTIAVGKLRSFFNQKGFVEVPVQHRLSILAACENPFNIAFFVYAGEVWPLPQTGQMWLEHELLKNPQTPGYYCISYSYRQEPDPIPGRHNLIFPMFEFEMSGDMEALLKLEKELLTDLGFAYAYHEMRYTEAAKRCGVVEIEDEHERHLGEEFGPVIFLAYFPEYTSPFWNMKREGDDAKKIDILLFGIETIGSSERSTDPEEMRKSFYKISNGAYAQELFAKFTKERVERELNEFLSLPFFPRSGGGIGMTRMIRALKKAGQIT